jgi:hypothetical protein
LSHFNCETKTPNNDSLAQEIEESAPFEARTAPASDSSGQKVTVQRERIPKPAFYKLRQP